MLVIANGANKSGSTWVFNLAFDTIPSQVLPQGWRREGWGNRSIDPKRLKEFLDATPDRTTILKMHMFPVPMGRDELLARDDVVVLNVARDLRGTVTSHYHWLINRGAIMGIRTYWDEQGRDFAKQICEFHKYWDVDSPAYHRFSYEGLLTDFAGEMEKARPVMERAGATFDAGELQRSTSRETMIEKGKAKGEDNAWFFRKGVADDWKNHLPRDVAEEIVEIGGKYAFLWQPKKAQAAA